ncbi:SDR family oxidoreductase [Sphingobacterium sp. E70]|uniref:SDR family oxidoreductase n=1 Tax=Sphingobacterium sp. E70 TaxID=2853439 RepID=UPI00211C3874|nr:SDR family oxidoreductase [Sphingobacterium sp. E70]ULT27878.1 SDR family oxidoreductase [Sphingobacterium sp. E70]
MLPPTGAEVAVCGRDISKLTNQPAYDALIKFEVDVCNRDALADVVDSFCNHVALDLFINCTGSYADDVAQRISYEEASAMLRVNMLGTLNCFEVASEVMRGQSKGQIATIASVSGTLDFPNSSLYSKTKRAAIQVADAYRRALLPYGITVTVIAPGYVDTTKLRQLNQQDLSKSPFDQLRRCRTTHLKSDTAKERNRDFSEAYEMADGIFRPAPHVLLSKIMFRKAKWMKND